LLQQIHDSYEDIQGAMLTSSEEGGNAQTLPNETHVKSVLVLFVRELLDKVLDAPGNAKFYINACSLALDQTLFISS
jgi:hypothetical protein